MDQTLRNEAGYEEYELDASNKDFAIVALDLLSGLGTVIHRSSIVSCIVLLLENRKNAITSILKKRL